MKRFEILCVFITLSCCKAFAARCPGSQSQTFTRWSGVSPENVAPVFVYSASGDEASLTGACIARCRELDDCAAVAVAYGRGNCYGVAATKETQLSMDSDVAYFQKVCLELPAECDKRWWALESTPGYRLHSDGGVFKVVLNTTIQECYAAVFSHDQVYRSAQWVGREDPSEATELIATSELAVGNCILNGEDKFTEPESYRVAHYQTFYIENQCRHDYSRKIDRCSYEEYYNQTLKHVEYSINKYTKNQCKSACEQESRFICRGFTWRDVSRDNHSGLRGACDLHSEDLVSTGSWLLRKTSFATYYRRVICLNITVECIDKYIQVTYKPRGNFRGRLYVPGRGSACGAKGRGSGGGRDDGGDSGVTLRLPLYGDCDVQFAYAISNTPQGIVNRTMAYVMVMVQNNPIIQTAGDRWVRAGCTPGGASSNSRTVDAVIAVRDTGKPSISDEMSANPSPASSVLNTAPLTSLSMYAVRVEDAPSPNSAVALGELLELRVETTEENEIEAYHLVASSRLGDSSVLLLDSRGCPTDQVDFPAFTRTWLSGTQRLSARFKAFRFPTSHVVRFALMIRYCDGKCPPVNCAKIRPARETNDTYFDDKNGVLAYIQEDPRWTKLPSGVVAQGGVTGCAGIADGRVPLEVEMVVGSKDILSSDTLVKADHRSPQYEEPSSADAAVVCVHELLLVALALTWLAVQILLLLGCCVLVKRYRNLAETSMQKDYHSFDNVGFDTLSTHRRVHWPDQTVDILHAT